MLFYTLQIGVFQSLYSGDETPMAKDGDYLSAKCSFLIECCCV